MRAVAAGFVLLALLPGCISAQRRIDANQAELFAAAAAETDRVTRSLERGGVGAYDVRFDARSPDGPGGTAAAP